MTRPFVFRLDRVCRVRERVEELAQAALASSLQAEREGADAVGQAGTRLERALAEQRQLVRDGAIDGDGLRAAQRYLEAVEAQRRQALTQLETRTTEVAACRDTLREAARERSVLERLRDRRLDEHVREDLRLSAVELDEVALIAHRRKAAA